MLGLMRLVPHIVGMTDVLGVPDVAREPHTFLLLGSAHLVSSSTDNLSK